MVLGNRRVTNSFRDPSRFSDAIPISPLYIIYIPKQNENNSMSKRTKTHSYRNHKKRKRNRKSSTEAARKIDPSFLTPVASRQRNAGGMNEQANITFSPSPSYRRLGIESWGVEVHVLACDVVLQVMHACGWALSRQGGQGGCAGCLYWTYSTPPLLSYFGKSFEIVMNN